MLSFKHVTYAYPSSPANALEDVTLDIPVPSRIAIVGASGAGKSTMADLILGLLQPTVGEVSVFDQPPANPRLRVAFVAQDVYVTPGTVRENVSLALHDGDADEQLIWSALEGAQIADFIRALPEKLETRLRDRGVRMSGGQRQRIGLARALYREPRLLVLDEATSSLDADTEASITASLASLADRIAVVTIAHRFSTIRNADWVVFLRDGRLVDVGSFDSLIAQYPDLATTAGLQGLA